jgi:putative membrane protein
MINHRTTLLAAAVAALFAGGVVADDTKYKTDESKTLDTTTQATPADPNAAQSTDAPTAPATTTAATAAGEPIDDKMEETASAGEERITDAKFFERGASANMLEVQLGELAQDKGTTADVKAFGARMVADHGKKIEEMKALAAKKEVTLPTALLPQHQQTLDRLSGMSGAEFDEGYIDFMVRAHRDMETLLRKTAEQTADNDIRTFANDTLKGVQDHYAHAQKLDAKNVVAGAEDDIPNDDDDIEE